MSFHDHLRRWDAEKQFSFIFPLFKNTRRQQQQQQEKLYLFKMPNSSCVSVLSLALFSPPVFHDTKKDIIPFLNDQK